MKDLAVKFVVITDGTDFVIHGSAKQSASEMFKALAPLWDFDPTTDTAFYFDKTLELPPSYDPNSN